IVGVPMAYRPYCTNQSSAVYPPENNCVNDSSLVGFTDLANNDYSLASTSAFKGKASDGTDPGVDMNALLAASNGTVNGSPIAITNPLSGSTVSGSVGVSAQPSPNVSATKVEFYLDGQLNSSTALPPYTDPVNTTTLPNGPHSFTAKVYNASGYIGASSPV